MMSVRRVNVMPPVYHLVVRPLWEQSPERDYRADSLTSEGFIHCSYADQVAKSANRFYATATDLVVLEIDPDQLCSPLKAEPADSGELFPHLYGPINRDAVCAVRPMQREAGQWIFSG